MPYLQFETKDELVRWLKENILTPQETSELLGTTLQAVGQSVRNGKLPSLKKQDRTTLFLREDVLARKKELEEWWQKRGPR